jgi:hypothetical protein
MVSHHDALLDLFTGTVCAVYMMHELLLVVLLVVLVTTRYKVWPFSTA